MQTITEDHAAAIKAARSEVEFWARFAEASHAAAAWPGGLLVLGTPCVRIAALDGTTVDAFLEELLEDDDLLVARRPLRLEALYAIRRHVRAGQYVVSVRDTRRQWSVVHDARDTGVRFVDAMRSNGELGLAPVFQSHEAA